MSTALDKVLQELDDPGITAIGSTGISTITFIVPTVLFSLRDINGQDVFEIKPDGSVYVNPKFTGQQAADEFWKWIATGTNVVQMAVDAARREERDACAKQLEDMATLLRK
jgi:hypothetical protein